MLRRSFKKKSKSEDVQEVASPRPAASEIESILGDYELPNFPTVVAQALDELGDPEIDMAVVAAIIERDPGATTRILRLVNSSTFSPRSTVTSVHQGAMMLGRNQLEALLISIGAHGVLPNPNCDGFVQRRFWTSASKRAILAAKIADEIDPTRRSQNFTAALLQDMALPVLALRRDSYGEVLEQWHNSEEDLAKLETDTFGWHHGTVASMMGTKWSFPETFVDFMGDHHDESSLDALRAARVVAPIREVDSSADERIIDECQNELGLTSDDLCMMIAAAEEESVQMADLLG